MIQQYLTVERLYLRKKHPELQLGSGFFYCWRKSKIKDQNALRYLAFSNTESQKKKNHSLKMIKRLRLFLKLFWIMVSPHNSPFTSTLPAALFSFNPPLHRLLRLQLLAGTSSPLFPLCFFAAASPLLPHPIPTCAPMNPWTGLSSSSFAPRGKTQTRLLQTWEIAEAEQIMRLAWDRAKSGG